MALMGAIMLPVLSFEFGVWDQEVRTQFFSSAEKIGPSVAKTTIQGVFHPIWEYRESWILEMEDPASAWINVKLYRRDGGGAVSHVGTAIYIPAFLEYAASSPQI